MGARGGRQERIQSAEVTGGQRGQDGLVVGAKCGGAGTIGRVHNCRIPSHALVWLLTLQQPVTNGCTVCSPLPAHAGGVGRDPGAAGLPGHGHVGGGRLLRLAHAVRAAPPHQQAPGRGGVRMGPGKQVGGGGRGGGALRRLARAGGVGSKGSQSRGTGLDVR